MDYNEILLFWLIIGKIHSKRAKLSHGRGGALNCLEGGQHQKYHCLNLQIQRIFL